MSLRAVLFWDLDGTLLLTGRAGLYAFEEALEEVTGATSNLHELSTPGFTDAGVARLVLEHAGQPSDPETVEAVLRSHERRLPDSLPRRQRVLDGIREVLEDLEGRDDVRSYLLTGNTPAGARAKLGHTTSIGSSRTARARSASTTAREWRSPARCPGGRRTPPT
jgi:phosphoglycolate phosphatase-like HAD superfamily hydrolase